MQPTAEPSGLFRAGGILILVGAILSAVSALMLLLLAGVFQRIGSVAGVPSSVGGIIHGVWVVILAAGSIFGFVAYGKARHGDARGAWVLGLVSSLLPPSRASRS